MPTVELSRMDAAYLLRLINRDQRNLRNRLSKAKAAGREYVPPPGKRDTNLFKLEASTALAQRLEEIIKQGV